MTLRQLAHKNRAPSLTQTANGAMTYTANSFGTDIENFFVMAERLLPIIKRKNSVDLLQDNQVESLLNAFEKAFAENPTAAMRILFYFRDPRGGQGRKSIFHVILFRIIANQPTILGKILPFIPKYGSWRDLQYLLANPNSRQVTLQFWLEQLETDMANLVSGSANISLAAKYFPTPNRGKFSRELFRKCFGNFNDKRSTNIQQLQALSRLKKALALVEQKMTAGNWNGINFSKVPARALKNYTKAFELHAPKEFQIFLNDLLDGKQVAHTTGVNPVEIISNLVKGQITTKAASALWQQLDINITKNILVMADTSSSMYDASANVKYMPIDICVSLAIFFAERLPASSPFYNTFLSFSSTPKVIKIKESLDLYKKYYDVRKAAWMGSTNVNAAFKEVLNTAVKHKSLQEDLPEMILIISDMQFDGGTSSINYDQWKQAFQQKGYELPQVIFWNVDTAVSTNPIRANDNNTLLISGQSPNVLKLILSGDFKNTRELIEEVLVRYNDIVL